MNIEEMNQVMKWLHEGTLQYKIGNSDWIDFSDTSPSIWYPKDSFQIYRRKPTPILRPWRPEEVPVGALYRYNKGLPSLIVDAGVNGFTIGNGVEMLYENSTDKTEHSLDHGKTWLPCGVVE